MSAWYLELLGHKYDLQQLAELTERLQLPEVIVKEEDGRFYLHSSTFDACGQAEEIYAQSANLVNRMNGYAKVMHDLDPVNMGVILRKRADGKPPDQFIFAGVARAKARGHKVSAVVEQYSALTIFPEPGGVVVSGRNPRVLIDGVEQATRTSEEENKLLILVMTDKNVGEALEYYNKRSRETRFYYLGKVCEVIEDDMLESMNLKRNKASLVKIAGLIGTTEEEVNCFKYTVNHVKCGEVQPRHSRFDERYEPPEHPMKLSEVEAFIKRILQNWMKWKISPKP